MLRDLSQELKGGEGTGAYFIVTEGGIFDKWFMRVLDDVEALIGDGALF